MSLAAPQTAPGRPQPQLEQGLPDSGGGDMLVSEEPSQRSPRPEDLENGSSREAQAASPASRGALVKDLPSLQPPATRALERLEGLLPLDLKFLAGPDCNPDLSIERFQVQGHMRSADQQRTQEDSTTAKGCDMVRNVVSTIVYSWLVQTLVYAIILLDLTLILVNFSGALPEGHTLYHVVDWLVVTVLSADVLARFFVEGCRFLKSRMNIFELLLVPITLVEVTLLKQMDLPVPLLRALRPTFRVIRLLRALARTANKGKGYLERLRHSVSGDRIRFTEDGFDLDLAYINSQVVAMSLPAVGRESILHNPHLEVARFLNERHGNKYLLLNATSERKYNLAPFFNRYVHFPIAKDGTPSLESLMSLCQVLDQFLKADPTHLLAVHSKHGQGRVSIIVLALLIYQGSYHNVNSAMAFYEHKRVDEDNQGTATTQTLDSASQRRLLDYFAHLCNSRQRSNGGTHNIREASLRRIQLVGLPSIGSVDVCCFGKASVASDQMQRRKRIKTEEEKKLRRMDTKEKEVKEGAVFEEEEDLEGGQEEDLEAAAMSIPEAAMMAHVTRILEEAALDSRAAGCAPMTGIPLVSSVAGGKGTENITFRSSGEHDDDMVPGIWDIEKTRLRGEFRIEVHRRKQKDSREIEEDKESKPGIMERLMAFLTGAFQGHFTMKQANRFDGGMLFCCWLHTNYLELDESKDMPSRLRPKNVVTVVLDRFHLDKAANAPSLRSHSAALKLHIEFEVDQRVDLRQGAGDGDSGSLFLASGMEICPPCPLGWLTWVSEKIWPSFQSGFEKLIRDSILPSLKESLPTPLKNIRLSKFSLGDAYPKFGPITACSQKHDGFEVQLDILLEYATDANILIEHAMAHFGIDHVGLKGILSLKFRPLLSELPVFSALQLYFQDSPEVTLKFNTPGNITDFPMVRSMISETIDQSLFDMLVLPNIMNINWGDPSNDNSLTFMSVLPTSVVRVEVKEARAIHSSNHFKKLPDVRVELRLGNQTGTTSVAQNQTNPVWKEESLDFLVYDERQHIIAGVYDIDFTGRATLLGKASKLSVTSVVVASEEGQGLWVDLYDDANQRISGQICLRADIFDLTGDLHKVETLLPDSALASRLTESDEGIEVHGEVADPSSHNTVLRSLVTPGSPKGLPTPVADHHGGAVAVLICDIFGGRLPPEIGQPGDVELRAGLGDSWGARRCSQAKQVDPGVMGEKTQQIVERLADRGLEADKIAAALDQDIADVHRIMRKRGWNLELYQKIPILIYHSDFRPRSAVELAIHVQGVCAARAAVPLSRLMQAGFNARFSDVITCLPPDGSPHKVDVDAEFRIFAMQLRPRDNGSDGEFAGPRQG